MKNQKKEKRKFFFHRKAPQVVLKILKEKLEQFWLQHAQNSEEPDVCIFSNRTVSSMELL